MDLSSSGPRKLINGGFKHGCLSVYLTTADAFEFQIMFAEQKTIISAFVQNRGHEIHGKKMNDSDMYAGNDSTRLSASNTKVT